MSKAEIQLSAVDQTKAAIDSAKRNLQGLGEQAANLRAGFGALGLAGAAAFAVTTLKGVIDGADELNKLSQRTGLATEQLSQLQYAAKLSDVSSETLTNTIKKLNISIAEGLAGDKEKIALFKSLGVSTADLGKGTQEVFLKIADAYAGARDGAGKVAVGNGLMGKSADEMIPFLNGGREGITKLMQEADKLGLTIGSDFAKNAEEFNDNLTRVEMSGKRLAITLGADVVRGLGEAMRAMADASIEGGKLAGIMAGIQTLFTGTDQHKNNVELVEQTNQLLIAENALARSRAKDAQFGDKSLETVANEKRLAGIKAQLATTMSYRKILDEEQSKSEKAAAALKAAKDKAGEIKVPTKTSGGESDAEKELKKQKQLVLELAGLSGSFIEDWDRLTAIYAKGGINLKQLTEEQAKLLGKQPAIKAAVELEQKLGEARAKTAEISDRYLATLTATNDQIVAGNALLTDQIEEIGLSTEALNLVRMARLDGNIAREEELLLVARGIEGNEAEVGQLERKLVLLKQERLLKGEAAFKEVRAQEVEEGKRRTEGISESISQGLLDGFRNGASLSELFLRELKAQFAKTVLQPIISPIVAEGNAALSGLFKGISGGNFEQGFASFTESLRGTDTTALATGDFARLDRLSFDGGGYTGDGLRSGGLDGKGGFMAMMHPQETVIDHTKGQAAGGGSFAPVYNINIDSRSDQAAIYAGVQQMLAQHARQQNEELRRAGVLA